MTLQGATVITPNGEGLVTAELVGQTIAPEHWKVWVTFNDGALLSFAYDAVKPKFAHLTVDATTLRFEMRGPFEHGGDDYEPATAHCYELTAYAGEYNVGRLTLDAEPDKRGLHVRWIEVDPSCRRQGIATQIIHAAQERWPGREFATNGFTDDGQSFWEARL